MVKTPSQSSLLSLCGTKSGLDHRDVPGDDAPGVYPLAFPVPAAPGAAPGSELCVFSGTPELSPADRKELEAKLKEREEFLAPMYQQVAIQFADLHDTPGRMQEKGAITVSVLGLFWAGGGDRDFQEQLWWPWCDRVGGKSLVVVPWGG